jgi:hypothetical protein
VPVEQGVLGMGVQMDEPGHPTQRPPHRQREGRAYR